MPRDALLSDSCRPRRYCYCLLDRRLRVHTVLMRARDKTYAPIKIYHGTCTEYGSTLQRYKKAKYSHLRPRVESLIEQSVYQTNNKFTIHAARAARRPFLAFSAHARAHAPAFLTSHQNPSNSAWSSSWHSLVSVTSCSASNHSNADETKTSGLTEPRSPKASSHAKCAPRKKACSLMSLAPSRRLPYRREMSFCSSLPGWGYGLRATGWG